MYELKFLPGAPLCGKGVMGGQGEITLDEIEANLK